MAASARKTPGFLVTARLTNFVTIICRRGLPYNFSRRPGGGDVAVNIPGFAFFGREPFWYINRVEQRHQLTDNFSSVKGRHNIRQGREQIPA